MTDIQMESTKPRTSYQIRKATLNDVVALQELINLSVRTLHTSYYTPSVISGALKSIFGTDTTLISDGHYFVISTTSSPETIIACGGWSNRTTLYGGDQFSTRDPTLLNPHTDAAKIRAMFVHPDWTRKGVGKFLIEACEAAAREAGFKKVELGATLSGEPFYKSMGYEIIGTEQSDIGQEETMEVRKMGKTLE